MTNDDGIFSPGLKAGILAVESLGEILIVAPKTQQTAMGKSFPQGPDIGIIKEVDLDVGGKSYHAYAVIGSPAQAVAHAVLEIADRKPTLCLSGINYGENVGKAILQSGTIGAAFEASAYGIAGLSVSVEAIVDLQLTSNYKEVDWSAAIYFTNYFARLLLDEGLPPGIDVINVNIPSSATAATPIRVTRQSMQEYFVYKKPGKRDFSKGFVPPIEVKVDYGSLEEDSDIKALVIDRVVSVTPLVQNLTSSVKWGRPEWQIPTTQKKR